MGYTKRISKRTSRSERSSSSSYSNCNGILRKQRSMFLNMALIVAVLIASNVRFQKRFSAMKLYDYATSSSFAWIATETETETDTATRSDSEAEMTPEAALAADPTDRIVRTSPRVASQASADYYNALRRASVREERGQKRFALYAGISGLGHRLLKQAGSLREAGEKGFPHMWIQWSPKRGKYCGMEHKKGEPDLFELLFGPGPMLTLHPNETLSREDPDLSMTAAATTTYTTDTATDTTATSTESASASASADFWLTNNLILYLDDHGLDGLMKHHDGSYDQEYICFAQKPRKDVREIAVADERFYRQLRSIFRYNDRISAFAKEHDFANRIVVGVHVRAGNGEGTDFEIKKRKIKHQDTFLKQLAGTIHQLIESISGARPPARTDIAPLVFVATDQQSVINVLAEPLKELGAEVVHFPQEYMAAGSGVTYAKNDFASDNECLEVWISQIIDSMLLGMADAIVAARYSSFTQSLPLMTLFSDSIRAQHESGSWRAGIPQKSMFRNSPPGASRGDDDPRFANRLFCEADEGGLSMKCFDDYVDWALNDKPLLVGSNFSLGFTRYQIEIRGSCDSGDDEEHD